MAEPKIVGILAEFKGPQQLLEAAQKVRDAGFKQFDSHSPFPIHGMDAAMGLGQSRVGLIAGVCAAIGFTVGYGVQWWTQAVDYPLIIAGKPYNSYQAFVPVTFGLTVLAAALGAVISMLVLNRLPQLHHEVFYTDYFAKVTNDGFFISILADDPKFDVEKTRAMLQSMGSGHVEVLREE